MTQEEKAKAYDEAIKRVRNIKTGECETTFIFTEGLFDYIFPELVESKDERIRKWLIYYFKEVCDNVSEKEKKSVLDWLERQVEYKPDDKVEPKFHEGDIIIHKELGGDYIHNPHKIIQVDILDKKYRLEGGLVAHFSEQEDYELVERTRLWSEEDEEILDDIIVDVEVLKEQDRTKGGKAEYQKEIDWLKSLRPQSHWKPSELQLECLDDAIKHYQSNGSRPVILMELLEELKKL